MYNRREVEKNGEEDGIGDQTKPYKYRIRFPKAGGVTQSGPIKHPISPQDLKRSEITNIDLNDPLEGL